MNSKTASVTVFEYFASALSEKTFSFILFRPFCVCFRARFFLLSSAGAIKFPFHIPANQQLRLTFRRMAKCCRRIGGK
jgi:hypothetical protein